MSKIQLQMSYLKIQVVPNAHDKEKYRNLNETKPNQLIKNLGEQKFERFETKEIMRKPKESYGEFLWNHLLKMLILG